MPPGGRAMEAGTEQAKQDHQDGGTASGFIAKVKRATRRRFLAEDKIRIVLEGMKREVSVADLCRHEGIHPHVYYTWVKHFMEAGKSRLKGDAKRNATTDEVVDLKRENRRLKVMLAEKMLEGELAKRGLLGEGEN